MSTESPPSATRIRAHWVLPVDQSPIENCIVEIENGRIVRLNTGPDRDALDLGDVALIPGLINAHTHLEFSDLRTPIQPAQPFVDWIRGVIAARQDRPTATPHAIDRGLHESAVHGTTAVGEIATSDDSIARFNRGTPSGVVFRELLGIRQEAAEHQLEIARQHLNKAAGTRSVLRGLSPHAPYSISSELFERCVELAIEAGVPVAMHLAETPEERQLLSQGTGPFVELLRSLGVWRERFWYSEGTIQAYLEVLSRAPRALVIHGNDLNHFEMEFLSTKPHMTVVYCPRTHRFFGHWRHPWRELLERRINVALGTDSRASNPDLSLWHELQFINRTSKDASSALLLEMATLRGAQALGLEHQCGSLTPGKDADLTIVSLSEDALRLACTHPAEAVLHPTNRVVGALRGGVWLHRDAAAEN